MDISCPRCRALLLLPADVVGREVCCPSCRSVFHAEASGLVSQLPDASQVPPPRLDAPIEPLHDDAEDDVASPAIRAQGSVAVLRRLYAAAFALRVVAVVDVCMVPVVAVLANLRWGPNAGFGFDDGPRLWVPEAIGGSVCGLFIIGPFSVLLWTTASGLKAVRLRANFQPAGLLLGIILSLVIGLPALTTLHRNLGIGLAQPRRIASILVVVAAGMTFAACLRALLARRAAFIACLPQRLGDAGAEVGDAWLPTASGQASQPPLPRSAQLARGGAHALALAASLLLTWILVNIAFTIAFENNPRVPWLCDVSGVAFGLSCLMLLGGMCLARLQRRRVVLAASMGAMVGAIAFALYLVHLMWSFTPVVHAPQDCFRAVFAAGLIVAHSLAGIKAWRVAHDPVIVRAFRK
jgi:hypothetical protein